MAEQPDSMFRRKSLERLSSPERLDQLLQLVDRRSWLPLSALGGLMFLILVWSVFGRIPMTVDGRGVLAQPRRIVQLESPASGKLIHFEVGVGDRIRAGELIAEVARPELETQLAELRRKQRRLEARAETARLLRAERASMENRSTRTKGDLLREHIRTSRGLAEEMKTRGLQTIAEERAALEEQWHLARDLPASLRDRLEGQRQLHEKGILSRQALIEAEESYMESLRRVSDLDSDLGELRTRELGVEEEYLNRMQRLADLTHDLEMDDVRETEKREASLDSETADERELIDVALDIANVETMLQRETRIVSDHDGVVIELSASVGQELSPGARVGAIAVEDVEQPLTCVVYFSVRDGKRLAPGLPVGVTPDTVERERFGSIRGTIRTVSSFPVSLEEAVRVVGNPQVAASLLDSGRLIQAEVALERDPEDGNGYRWSSSRGPSFPVSAGTTSTARAVVEYRRPIAFVLPFLKTTAGVD